MYPAVCQWKYDSPSDQDGVIVGCTHHLEWMLPWWWMHYSMHNQFPVVFFDMGNMTEKAKHWCKLRGELVTLSIPLDEFVTSKEKLSKELISLWELHGDTNLWVTRLACFLKPFACLHSPFKRTAWLDLDCQTRQSIAPIFPYCQNEIGLALAEAPEDVRKDHVKWGLVAEGEKEYNAGVFVCKHGSELLQEWSEMIVNDNHTLSGDQKAINRIVNQKKLPLPTLPSIFNKRWFQGVKNDDIIIHWIGDEGKSCIQSQIQLLESHLFFMNFSSD